MKVYAVYELLHRFQEYEKAVEAARALEETTSMDTLITNSNDNAIYPVKLWKRVATRASRAAAVEYAGEYVDKDHTRIIEEEWSNRTDTEVSGADQA